MNEGNLQEDDIRDDQEGQIDDISNLKLITETKNENNAKFDNEFQKRFGRLYKSFDVRYIKSKIWESINRSACSEEATNKFTFKQLISSVSCNLDSEIKSNLSTQTCFVCLLHLANEKGSTVY